MPTQHPRVTVTKDPELAEALRRVRALVGEVQEGRLLRELAIRGAAATLEEAARRSELLERFVVRSSRPGWLGMTDAEIDRDAWSH